MNSRKETQFFEKTGFRNGKRNMNLIHSHRDTILIVDDIQENVALLFRFLTHQGFNVLVAESGKIALQTFEYAKPDIVLLDITMPGMDGFEVCRILKSQEETQDIPIIFMTALSDISAKLKGFRLGAGDYITKPFRRNEVLARVNAHLEIYKLQKQLKAQNQQLQELTAELEKRNKIITLGKEKSDKLLLNILPARVANDLKETGKTKPECFKNVTVFFSDIVGFTQLSAQLEPNVLIDELNSIFTAFDNIIEKHQCERIKTIGDAYLCVCGMPEENPHHAENIVQSAIEIIEYLEKRTAKIKWEVRIGIHTGKVIGGVVGFKKYIYDVFGDTINTASRMETNSVSMKINISETTYHQIKDKFKVIERGSIPVKGKGSMKMYFISR